LSTSKRNFLIGISLLLVVIILIGCLPNKQGGFTCVCVPVISKIRSMLHITKPIPSDTSPGQVPSSDAQANWWKDQPDFKQEEAALNSRIKGLSNAFAANDIEDALNYFQVEQRDRYRQLFSQSPNAMSKMASGLNNAKLSFFSAKDTQLNRIAECCITIDGRAFYISFIKVDGQWMLRTF